MAAPEHPHEVALQKFLAARPELREALDHLNPLAAQARGETQEQYRAERLHEAFETEAERQGLFAWELSLQLTAQSAEERRAAARSAPGSGGNGRHALERVLRATWPATRLSAARAFDKGSLSP